MTELIEWFKPDIIFGEVRPEDWQKHCDNNAYNGYLGPNEYRGLILPLCEENNIKFIPVDWFDDDMIKMDYFQGKSEVEVNSLEKQFESIMSEYMEVAKESVIPFNSLAFNNIVEKKQEFQNSINADVHNVYWIRRNQIMLERVKSALDINKGKRILCMVGAEHTYLYYRNLKENNYEVIYPLK